MTNELTDAERIAAEKAAERREMISDFRKGFVNSVKTLTIAVGLFALLMVFLAALIAFGFGMFELAVYIFRICGETVWGGFVAVIAVLSGVVLLFSLLLATKRMIKNSLYRRGYISSHDD